MAARLRPRSQSSHKEGIKRLALTRKVTKNIRRQERADAEMILEAKKKKKKLKMELGQNVLLDDSGTIQTCLMRCWAANQSVIKADYSSN